MILADGHPAMLYCLRGLVEAADGMELAAETGDGDEVVSLVKEETPDLVVLALNLTGETDGITVCQVLKTLPRPPRVLVFTAYNFEDDVASCLLAGADSYLHKRHDCEEVLGAMKETAEGKPRVENRRAGWRSPIFPQNELPGREALRERAGGRRTDDSAHVERGDRAEALRQRMHRQVPREAHLAEARPQEPLGTLLTNHSFDFNVGEFSKLHP